MSVSSNISQVLKQNFEEVNTHKKNIVGNSSHLIKNYGVSNPLCGIYSREGEGKICL